MKKILLMIMMVLCISFAYAGTVTVSSTSNSITFTPTSGFSTWGFEMNIPAGITLSSCPGVIVTGSVANYYTTESSGKTCGLSGTGTITGQTIWGQSPNPSTTATFSQSIGGSAGVCSSDADCGGTTYGNTYCNFMTTGNNAGNLIRDKQIHSCVNPGTTSSSCRVDLVIELVQSCPNKCAATYCIGDDACATMNCNDGNACTTDSCSNGQCSHVSNGMTGCNGGNSGSSGSSGGSLLWIGLGIAAVFVVIKLFGG